MASVNKYFFFILNFLFLFIASKYYVGHIFFCLNTTQKILVFTERGSHVRVTDVHASTTAAFEKFGQGADYLLNGDNAALVHVSTKILGQVFRMDK